MKTAEFICVFVGCPLHKFETNVSGEKHAVKLRVLLSPILIQLIHHGRTFQVEKHPSP
jgi:hypothetical protein